MTEGTFQDNNESTEKTSYWNETISRRRPVKFKNVFSLARTEQKKINCQPEEKYLGDKTKDDATTAVRIKKHIIRTNNSRFFFPPLFFRRSLIKIRNQKIVIILSLN